ncbi:MAG TPA: beta-ketoacyl synthase N-terminal-like domain-containing protein [Streptosporangiaceae bacterium]
MRASAETEAMDAVAIIGMAGRFPGSPDIAQFWHYLRAGTELITFFTPAELAVAGLDRVQADDPSYVPAKGVLDGADLFDAEFFRMAPREAELADPQQRLLLESAWAALEDAGIRATAGPSVGMFVGAGPSDYPDQATAGQAAAGQTGGGLQAVIARDVCYLSSRVSYKLGLTGPSMTVQTACSSSLVAVHLACMALLGGECDLAIAGGVAVHLPLASGYLYQEGLIYSPDGHCRAFDADAAGTVGGDGLACVVLRRLEDAVDADDDIYAVIRGTAVNNDGADKVGFTAPSVSGQVAVVRAAHAAAGTAANTIDYIEAHGTGTALGDPIELAALAEVFAGSGRDTPIMIGSVKTNIGHLDTASGIAGLVKAALALRHREIPPTLHFRRPNPNCTLPSGLFSFPTSRSAWDSAGRPRRAGVSSFGIGGTNAHAVLEEYQRRPPTADPDPCHLLTLSARTPEALDAMAGQLARWVTEHGDVSVGDIAYTLQVGRAEFDYRRALASRGLNGISALTHPAAEGPCWQQEAGQPAIAFVFSGQGAQQPDAVRELYQQEPFFAGLLDELGAQARESGVDVLGSLLPPPGHEQACARELARPEIAQPALFVQEYALARLWQRWGVEPAAMLGNSLGEYVAACLAGVLPPAEMLDLMITRGRLSAGLCPEGAMTAVAASPDRVTPLLGGRAQVATQSAPERCVISGAVEAVRRVEQALTGQGIAWRLLEVRRAYHSGLMRPMSDEFSRALAGYALKQPSRPFISCVTGTWITPEQAISPRYWADEHLLGTMRLGDGIAALAGLPQPALLGVGPYENLARLARLNHRPPAPPPRVISSLASPSRPVPASESVARALGQLWTAGADIDWTAVHREHGRRRVHLPAYPFQRRRHWIGAPPDAGEPAQPRQGPAHPRAEKPPRDQEQPQDEQRDAGAGGYDAIELTVRAIFGEILGIEDVDPTMSFFDLGGDSLTGTQVAARITEVFGTKISLREFFDDPTAATLAAQIHKHTTRTERP